MNYNYLYNNESFIFMVDEPFDLSSLADNEELQMFLKTEKGMV